MKALFLFMVSLVLVLTVSCENPELTKNLEKGVLESQVQFGFSKSFDSARTDAEKLTEQEVTDSTDWKVLYWRGVDYKEQAFKEQNVIIRKVLFNKSLDMILKSINHSPETIEQDPDFYDTVHAYDMLNILYGTNGLDNPLVQYLAIQIAVAMGGEIIDVLGIQVSDVYTKRYAELKVLESSVKPLANRDKEAAVTKLRWFLQGVLGYVRGEFDVALDELEGLINEYPDYILKEKINRLLAICQEKRLSPVGEVTDIVSVLVYDFDKIKKLVNRGLELYGRENKNDKEIETLAKQAIVIAVLKVDADKNPDELFYHAQALLLLPIDSDRSARGRELVLKAIAIGVLLVDYPLWDKVAGNGKLGRMVELHRLGILRPRRSAAIDDTIAVPSLFDMKQLMLPGIAEDRGQGYFFVWSDDDVGNPKSKDFLNEGVEKISAEMSNLDSEYDYKLLLYYRSQVYKALGDKANSNMDEDRYSLLE